MKIKIYLKNGVIFESKKDISKAGYKSGMDYLSDLSDYLGKSYKGNMKTDDAVIDFCEIAAVQSLE